MQTHVIVGGGMTGHAAAAAIREKDPGARVVVLGAEPEAPYARPPLTKGLWLGKEESSVLLAPVDVDWLAGRRAVSVDTARHEVTDDQGGVHRYDRLLLATGGRPRRLPFGGDRVIYYRTLADYRRLRGVAGKRVAVIGGGFIGSEIAASLAQNGKEVTMVFPDARIGARVYPAGLGDFLMRTYEDRCVRVLAGEQVTGIEARGDETAVLTGTGQQIVADAVVAGIGIVPETTLAEAAGIRCSDGIEVDARLETSAPDVFAAGDVARFPSPALGRSIRVEHEDAALTMGAAAGRIMAGSGERYEHLPFFYSDMFDLGYEAVGVLDARLETIESWKTPFREGAIYYLDGDAVRGVLLWGMFGHVDAARALIEGRRAVPRAELVHAIE
ncbi:NAD(P)/FAD-dependent oxidoreductase [Anaeromyxobacter oryzae]|uniref:N-acylamino acid racemase n=1 Tax=Anaeromyxobacter oryzae TaxID=2918170 RepID=A0ABM7WUC0_9BACT|nr:FAD/NAD(P)-binding oxidoreductase [Anaeromyxobacter oryzae]BDG03060.1 N-acylamino acid racemase [Anaeromyxobacter oryzae]